MKQYSVAPNADASRWIVKIEDVAPEESYPTKDAAINAALDIAKANNPSKVLILDKEHNVIEEKSF
ncbi:DUF2188 domain-containing protein [Halalkalibacter nanhaiisediminis]|uniref:Uncharacterized protein DUF2188 n=1 Tax=Halalkalibacter nanhaiisediminis TaxID=688079 RepID=A0A562QEI4_9BACI|nr:DUF2188 domain-containing protein [Halalkalibacter nanhaiisediminis]TWI54456.1 uncharacterized protein DUF2188 [Halalkalibacter nanhaiisediminis]